MGIFKKSLLTICKHYAVFYMGIGNDFNKHVLQILPQDFGTEPL